RFSDDVVQPGQAYAYFLRSPHAAAKIVSIDATAATATPGVLAVVTGDDMQAAGVTNITRAGPMAGRDGKKLGMAGRPARAHGRGRHIGEPIACIVADDPRTAQDAAELVVVEYEEETPVIEVQEADAADGPPVHEAAPNNVALDWPGPAPDQNIAAAEAAFAK